VTGARLDLDEIVSTVHGAAKRVTVAKRTVATVLLETTGHLNADELTQAVQAIAPEVSHSTVYRILEEFEELGIVEHAHLGHSAAVYHLAGAVHGHLVCEHCGGAVEIPASDFDSLSAQLRRRYDFHLNRHHVAISGLCAHCANAATS
jgi:Fur family transcriptional regulator, ferric uptake regulator